MQRLVSLFVLAASLLAQQPAADDTATVADCIRKARENGSVCHLSAGDYRVTKTIRMAASPIGQNKSPDGSIINLAGDGHSAFPGARSGTRIICAMRDGSPCIDIDVSAFSVLTIRMSGLMFVGPDSGPAKAVSGEGVRIHGGSEPRLRIEDVGFAGFQGAGKFALSAEGAEGSTFRNLYCVDNSGCLHGFNAFNGNVIENIYASETSGPSAVLIENADGLSWIGGILQANARTALRLHGVIASWFRGTHFECDNAGFPVNCKSPKPTAGDGAIVLEASEGVTNQMDSFENLVMDGPNDKVFAVSTDGKGANSLLKFENFYDAGVSSPKFVFDKSTSRSRIHGAAAAGQYEDKGARNEVCLGAECFTVPEKH